jgi:hypothetical protein
VLYRWLAVSHGPVWFTLLNRRSAAGDQAGHGFGVLPAGMPSERWTGVCQAGVFVLGRRLWAVSGDVRLFVDWVRSEQVQGVIATVPHRGRPLSVKIT